jgi:hypothetical protein
MDLAESLRKLERSGPEYTLGYYTNIHEIKCFYSYNLKNSVLGTRI